MSTVESEEDALIFKNEIDVEETKIDLEDEQMKFRSQEETHDIVGEQEVINQAWKSCGIL